MKFLLEITGEDKEHIYRALNMWKNYIETGNIVLSAADAKERGEKYNALSVDQMKFIVHLEDLKMRVLGAKAA